ncbi:MAG: transposase [bacterium]|nr:transposase [bacterium]
MSIERDVRQMLSDKISGTYVGLWLLLPEHLRLGTWDILSAWTGCRGPEALDPRIGLQMVNESALCVNWLRGQRTLRHKGFETLNGLPFVATDQAIHRLLDQHTISEAEALQGMLGKIREARGHYPGPEILLDPHRIQAWTKRQVQPKKAGVGAAAQKTLQTFFAIDSRSSQPIAMGIGSSSVTVSQATRSIIERTRAVISNPALFVGDSEHFTVEVLDHLAADRQFTVLMPTPRYRSLLTKCSALQYRPLWAGYAVAEDVYQLGHRRMRLLVQRVGETPQTYDYKPFVTTSDRRAVDLMGDVFPERWNIEEFFNLEGALGWNRAATLNLNIRFGRLSLALIAQAAIFQFKQRVLDPINTWTAESMAHKLFGGIDGDLRVHNDTIIVTLYNAPNVQTLKAHYQNLPRKLEAEGIDPRVPWLYNFKVDFRFK